MNYQPIEDYGLIGNMRTAALVGRNGSIDFLCYPDFDSPSIFAGLLDHQKGGRFQLHPVLPEARAKQLYLPDNNVLLSRFLSDEGVAEVSDFMPVADDSDQHALVRRAKTVRGEVRFEMIFAPRFDYGRAGHRVEMRNGEVVFHADRPRGLSLRLRADRPLQVVEGDARATFTLGTGETAAFILDRFETGEPSAVAEPGYVARAFKETSNYWRNWIGRSTYRGRWQEIVHRSALVLKLLTSRQHGSLVAAPTFGVPESIGGLRNWDYRYTWIRDASFTVYSLMRLGLDDEARRFILWLEDLVGALEDGAALQVMYGLDGHTDLTEETLDHMEGYRQSAPVRIGNGAYGQLQLDIYGELMDSVYLYDKYGEPIHYDFWRKLIRIVDWVCDNWRLPDEGIWEVRGGRKEFLSSRVMCWVAVDRALRLARKRSLPAPHDRWLAARDAIYRDVFENFWDPRRRAFMQHRAGEAVDASALLMPLVRFIGPTDRRWLSTLAEIERQLVDDSLVRRYHIGQAAPDGFSGPEGTFSMCSFWFVECVGRTGDLNKARFLFEKVLGYANHLGLYSEQLGPRGEHLGNYPQALTHLALISAAFDLDRRLSRAGWRA